MQKLFPSIRLASFLAAASFFPCLGVAQEFVSNDETISKAYQRFVEQNPGDWSSDWSKATGTPRAIFGPGLRLQTGEVSSLGVARSLGRQTLTRYEELLGLRGSTFSETIGLKIKRVYVLVYEQKHRGLRVLGGRADIRIHDNGVLSMFGSEAVQIPNAFAVTPRIETAFAEAVALDHLGLDLPALNRKGNQQASELVVWAQIPKRSETPVRLAWEVKIDQGDIANAQIGRVYVDALSGALLEFRNDVYTCKSGHRHVRGNSTVHSEDSTGSAASTSKGHDLSALLGLRDGLARTSNTVAGSSEALPVALTGTVMAWTNTGLRPTDPMVNTPMANMRVSAAGVGVGFTDASGKFSIPYGGTTAVNVTVNFTGRHLSGMNPSQGTRVSVTQAVTPGTAATIQMMTAASSEFDRSQSTIYYHVDDANVWLRGLIPSGTSRLNAISGMTARPNIAQSCNASYGGNRINFYAKGGSCNMTAFSTVIYHEWGHGLDDVFGGISNQFDGLSEGWGDIIALYRTGQAINGSGFFLNGGFVRTGTNSTTYAPGGSSVHRMGESWMGWAWDVRTSLIASNGAVPGATIAESIVVASIAADAKDQKAAVREVFLLDDNDGNLNNGVPHYAELSAASKKRLIDFPELKVGIITSVPLQTTPKQLTPRLVQAKIVPLLGSFTSVELFYRAGFAQGRRPMVANGNDYSGLVPGVASPTAVTYHIEAKHSTGVTVRWPETGEVSYGIGNEQVVWSDNFDGVNPGWTHAQLATQDDWQWASPNGKSGSSNGVSWSDPGSASSGTKVRGNDLGPSGFNGSYQPNVHNYLRSPVLNMTGKVGLELRFKRWLTVEEGQYDQATILVNGQVVWSNPLSGHVLDTSWKAQSIKIPMADNRAAVTIEWRLKSDAGLHLGGWNIDDVEIVSVAPTTAPPVQFRVTPAQIGIGKGTLVRLDGAANAPLAIVFGDSAGPTSVPGLPSLAVGGNLIVLPAQLDATGNLIFNFSVANDPQIVGTLFYAQALQLAAGKVELSNEMLILFGN